MNEEFVVIMKMQKKVGSVGGGGGGGESGRGGVVREDVYEELKL